MFVDLPVLLAFAAASFVLLVVPGPTIIMVVSQALAHGNRAAMASVLGVGLGDLLAASLSLLGVGTILAASAAAFTAMKWVGAAYLVWIGVKMWRSPITPLSAESNVLPSQSSDYSVFRDAFLVTLFNPKGIVFFVAFVPQFISPDREFSSQAAVLISIFVLLGMFNASVYALLAGSARQWIQQPGILKFTTRLGSAFLISAGLASLFVRRPG